MNTRIASAAVIALAVIGGFYSALRAQGHTVWDGVYTQEQATRGNTLYDKECVTCHGKVEKGEAVDTAMPLISTAFSEKYDGQGVGVLFEKTAMMPVSNEKGLSPQASADIVAYMLQINGFPAGKTELPTETAALNMIKYVVKKP